MPRFLCFVFFAMVAAVGCGGSSPPADDPGEDPTCAGYAPSNPCMNPENFELCKGLESQCPGQVQVMESCPFQFSCPTEPEAEPEP